jgi:hypothetical protein
MLLSNPRHPGLLGTLTGHTSVRRSGLEGSVRYLASQAFRTSHAAEAGP